jgi:hypothetical protein
VLKELRHPTKSAGFAFIPITLVAFAAQQAQHHFGFARVVFWAGLALSCMCAPLHAALLMACPWSDEPVSPIWIVPPLAGLISAAVLPLVREPVHMLA